MTNKLPLPQLNGDVLAYDELQTNEINKMVDYPIEIGSNENGRWIKYNSGRLVQKAYRNFTQSTGYPVNWSPIYRTNTVRMDYPIPFVSGGIDVVKSGHVYAGDIGWMMQMTPGNHSMAGEFAMCRPGSSSGSVSFQVSFIADGFWK